MPEEAGPRLRASIGSLSVLSVDRSKPETTTRIVNPGTQAASDCTFVSDEQDIQFQSSRF